MTTLCDALRDNFTIVSLGCIGDEDYVLPRDIKRLMTVVEADAQGGAQTGSDYRRKIVISKPIAEKPGPRKFVRHSFAGTCSLLPPRPDMVNAYAMHRYCDSVEQIATECETIPMLLEREKIRSLDFLKTDIEGLDAAIIRSCESYLGRTLCIQAELRFEAYYEGEPEFHETTSYLAGFGYEVVDLLHIDRWKYKTRHWKTQLEGRSVWADFLFFLKPECIAKGFDASEQPTAIAKHIILAAMLGKKNYAEHVLERFANVVPNEWHQDLRRVVRPGFPSTSRMRNALRRLFMPVELFLKHRINRSCHVSLRQGN